MAARGCGRGGRRRDQHGCGLHRRRIVDREHHEGRERAHGAGAGADRRLYQGFLARGESALPFPVGGELTQYQLLQGALIGSAGNYIDYLTSQYWTNDAVFASAARTWLARHNLGGITVVEPTGIDPANAATPDAVIGLGELALADPVIAEIVRTPQVELPGAGLVANTNDLLVDPTVVGLKTGTLDGQFNLLAAKDVAVG